MDALTALLDGPRARDAFLLRAILNPPWSVSVRDEAPLSLIAVARGHAWAQPLRGEPARLGPGDVAVLRGPDPYVFADAPETQPQVVIHPGQRCTTLDGTELFGPMGEPLSWGVGGIRTWGNDPTGSAMMLIGSYQIDGELSREVLEVLPPMLLLTAAEWDSPLVSLLDAEIEKDSPGQQVILDRLLDLLLIAVLRTWLGRPGGHAPGWFTAQSDPVVGGALTLIHDSPQRPWTVASLAQAVGTSRAGLARRFTELVGEPPLTYLTGWRLRLAADLLRDTDDTIAAIARKVGYGSPFALSAAFKRVRGVTPAKHRRVTTDPESVAALLAGGNQGSPGRTPAATRSPGAA